MKKLLLVALLGATVGSAWGAAIQDSSIRGSIHELVKQGKAPQIVAQPGAGTTDLRHMLSFNGLGLTNVDGLKEIPGIEKVQYLDLQNNNLTYLPADTFAGLKNLMMIHLNNNNIDRIERGTFTLIGNPRVHVYLFANELKPGSIAAGELNFVENPKGVYSSQK